MVPVSETQDIYKYIKDILAIQKKRKPQYSLGIIIMKVIFPTIVVKKQVHMLKNLSQCVIRYENCRNNCNILINIGKHCIFYMLQGMSYHIKDIGFYFLAFLANGQPDHNEHHIWVMVQSAFSLSSLVLYFVVLVVFHVNYMVSLCLNESVLQLFQMKRRIMIFDSLCHLRIAGSAADITTKHSP